MNGKDSQKIIDHAQQSATDARKTSTKIVIQNAAKLTGTKAKVSKNLRQTNLETFTNKHDKEIPK